MPVHFNIARENTWYCTLNKIFNFAWNVNKRIIYIYCIHILLNINKLALEGMLRSMISVTVEHHLSGPVGNQSPCLNRKWLTYPEIQLSGQSVWERRCPDKWGSTVLVLTISLAAELVSSQTVGMTTDARMLNTSCIRYSTWTTTDSSLVFNNGSALSMTRAENCGTESCTLCRVRASSISVSSLLVTSATPNPTLEARDLSKKSLILIRPHLKISLFAVSRLYPKNLGRSIGFLF